MGSARGPAVDRAEASGGHAPGHPEVEVGGALRRSARRARGRPRSTCAAASAPAPKISCGPVAQVERQAARPGPQALDARGAARRGAAAATPSARERARGRSRGRRPGSSRAHRRRQVARRATPRSTTPVAGGRRRAGRRVSSAATGARSSTSMVSLCGKSALDAQAGDRRVLRDRVAQHVRADVQRGHLARRGLERGATARSSLEARR